MRESNFGETKSPFLTCDQAQADVRDVCQRGCGQFQRCRPLWEAGKRSQPKAKANRLGGHFQCFASYWLINKLN